VKVYELRWPIIHDRWLGQTMNDSKQTIIRPDVKKGEVASAEKGHVEGGKEMSQDRSIQELQHRYYKVTTILNRSRLQKAATIQATATTASTPLTSQYPPNHPSHKPNANIHNQSANHAQKIKQVADSIVEQQAAINALASGTSTQEPYYLDQENERRNQLELLWNRPKCEEKEEIELRRELKLVEAQIRKLKKAGSHLLKQSGARIGAVGVRSPALSRSNSPVPSGNYAGLVPNANPHQFDPAFSATAPIPTAGLPYLQSARLATPATGGHNGLPKSLIQKMDATLKELKIPERPVCPTKRVCDAYDNVRKKALILLSLEKITMKKEAEMAKKRRKVREIQTSLDIQQQHLQQQQNMQMSAATRNMKSNAMVKNKVVVVNGNQIKPSNSNKRSISMANANAMSMNIQNMGTNVTTTTNTSRKTTGGKSKRRTSTSKSKQASDSSSVNIAGDTGSITKKATKRKSKKQQQSASSIAAGAIANSKGNKSMAMSKSKSAAMNAAALAKQSNSKNVSKKNMANVNMSAATAAAVASMPMPTPIGTNPRPMYAIPNVNIHPVTNPVMPKTTTNSLKSNRANMTPAIGMMNVNTMVTMPNSVSTKNDVKPSKKRARKN